MAAVSCLLTLTFVMPATIDKLVWLHSGDADVELRLSSELSDDFLYPILQCQF
jgi:hypothetical protein